MWLGALLLGIALVGATGTHPTVSEAHRFAETALDQFVDINPDTTCPTGVSAVLAQRGTRVCYWPAQQAEVYADTTCPSGYNTFLVATGVRVCYTPDEVAENSDLQDRCKTDPSLYICPNEEN